MAGSTTKRAGKGAQTRARMVEVAMALFQRDGYAATGLKAILTESETPRGSFYFHFPDGKDELAEAVVRAHAEAFVALVIEATTQATTPLEAAEVLLDVLAARVEADVCGAGCPVTTIALEASHRSERLRVATQEAYAMWANLIAAPLQAAGWSEAEATQRARALLAMIEGALILCRSQGDASPLRDVRATLPHLLQR